MFILDSANDAVVRIQNAAEISELFDPLFRAVRLPREMESPDLFDPDNSPDTIEFSLVPRTTIIGFEVDTSDDNVWARNFFLRGGSVRGSKGELDLTDSGATPQEALKQCQDFCMSLPECVAVEVGCRDSSCETMDTTQPCVMKSSTWPNVVPFALDFEKFVFLNFECIF